MVFFLLLLKVLLPAFLFGVILHVAYKYTEKRTSHSQEYLNFEDWFSREFESEFKNEKTFNSKVVYREDLNESHLKDHLFFDLTDPFSKKQLKSVYREFVQKYHPDKYLNGTKEDIRYATKKLIQTKRAYQNLKEYFEI